jgi:hypothetical protein
MAELEDGYVRPNLPDEIYVNLRVEARWKKSRKFFTGQVVCVNSDGQSFGVRFDDGDMDKAVRREHMRGHMELHSDACHICNKVGELLCCDQCCLVYHVECLGLAVIPDGFWLCPVCAKVKKDKKSKLTVGAKPPAKATAAARGSAKQPAARRKPAAAKALAAPGAPNPKWREDKTPCTDVQKSKSVLFCFPEGPCQGTAPAFVCGTLFAVYTPPFRR